MARRYRIGLVTAGLIVLGVLLYAGVVWKAEGVMIERRIQQPDLPSNSALIVLDIGALPGLRVYPGANVEIKCDANNDGESIAFACKARERVRIR